MLPREIQVEHWPERTTYDLPMRPIGKFRWIGLVPILFGIAFLSMPVRGEISFLTRLLRGEAGPFDYFFALFLSLFLCAGLVPFGFGLLFLIGRTRLVALRDRFIVTEIAGPVRWRRSLHFKDIERLTVVATSSPQQPHTAGPEVLAKLGGLGAALRDGKRKFVLMGYPREWLEPFAQELSGHMSGHGAPVDIEHVEPKQTTADSLLRAKR
jgi:hypothetical protein